MNAIPATQQPNGTWNVGGEILSQKDFQARLEALSSSPDKGLFKIGDTLTVTAAELSKKIKNGDFSLGGVDLPPPGSTAARGFDTGKIANLSAMMAEVFKLVTETSMTNRETSRESRKASHQAEQASLANQVEMQREAAQKAFTAAVAAAAVSIGVAVGSAIGSIGSAAKGLKDLKSIGSELQSGAIDAKAAERLTAMAQQTQTIRQAVIDGTSGAVKGAADIGKAHGERAAELTRIGATEAESVSRIYAKLAQEDTEFINHFQEILRDFMQKMASINESTQQSLAGIMRA
jgi:hypothetical protein